MKNIKLLFVILFCCKLNAETQITFQNNTQNEVEIIMYYDFIRNGVLTTTETIKVKPKTKLKQTLTINNFGYFELRINKIYTNIWVYKNENNTVLINNNTTSFVGKSKEINTFLYDNKEVLTTKYFYDNIVSLTCGSVANCYNNIYLTADEKIKKLKKLYVSKKITKEEYNFIHSEIYIKLIYAARGYPYKTNTNVNRDIVVSKFFEDFNVFEIFPDNRNFEYYYVIDVYCDLIQRGVIGGKLNNIGLFSVDSVLKNLNYAPNNIQKKYAIYNILKLLNNKIVDYVYVNVLYNDLINVFPNDDEVKLLEKQLNRTPYKEQYIEEKYTFFEMNSENNLIMKSENTASLYEFLSQNFSQHKLILFDLWATWCKPCVDDFRHYEAIKDILEENNIAVIFINLDDLNNVEKSKKYIINDKLIGGHLFLSQQKYDEIKKLFNLGDDAIFLPQRFLVDKKGKIITSFFPSFAKKNEIETFFQNHKNQ